MNRRLLFFVALAILVCAAGVVWLSAAPSIGTTAVSPTVVGVNTPAQVTVTAQISDATLISTSVNILQTDATGRVLANLGRMYDDGTNGDTVSGDKTFSRSFPLTTSSLGDTYFQVTAAFKGMARRQTSALLKVAAWNAFDDQLGLAIKYPPELQPIRSAPNVIGFSDGLDGRESAGLWIEIEDSADYDSLYDWWKAQPYYSPDQLVTNRTLAGEPAIRVVVDPEGLPETHLVVMRGARVFDILLAGIDRETAERMLETLTFR
jgi:hypothetical protein